MAKASEAFRTISEVAEELDVQKHVLRFWENKFPQVRPMKRGGGRRYYRPDDLDLLRGIRFLLHREGYTIKGVQKLLREQGLDFVKVCWHAGNAAATPPTEEATVAKPGRKPRKAPLIPIGSIGRAASAKTGPTSVSVGGIAASAAKRTSELSQLDRLLVELDACRRILQGREVVALANQTAVGRSAKS